MKRLLFVDDEPNILEALERSVSSSAREWSASFASDGEEALRLMEATKFDVIVTDMRMPGMDGATLLAKVKEQHPETIRFVLSGQIDQRTAFQSVGPAHQFMTKPCDLKILKAHIDSAFALRDMLASDKLARIISEATSLPVLPQAYSAVMSELRSENASIRTVGEIVESDIGMSAKILQLVNSAFFGLGQPVACVTQAVSLLGLDTVKALVLMVGVFSLADEEKLSPNFKLEKLWRHSMNTGRLAESIAKAERLSSGVSSDALTAGLLHDSGRLLLAVNFCDDYKHVTDFALVNHISLLKAELEILGCTHAEVGAYLLSIWGLPDAIVQAVAYHHNPSYCPVTAFSALAAVHAADFIEHQVNDPDESIGVPEIDMGYMQRIGTGNRLDTWRALCPGYIAKKEEKL